MDHAIWDPFSTKDFKENGDPATIYERHLQEVQEAEQLGFNQYYLIEHQNSAGLKMTSMTTFFAAMTQRTSVIRIGAMIFPLPFFNPMRLAQDVATLDQLSRGRFEFGTGIGVTEAESYRFGLDYSQRQMMGEEALEIIKMAWTQDEVTYDGDYWQFRGHKPFPRPYQQPYPPIWVGAHSFRAHEFAARNSYGCAANIDTDEVLAEKFAYFRKIWGETHSAEQASRTFLMRQVYVDDTDEKAHEVARAHFGNTWGKNNDGMVYRDEHKALGLNPSGYGSEDTPEIRTRIHTRAMLAGENGYEWALDNGIFIVGSPDTVASTVERTVERMGGLEVFCANFEFGQMPLDIAHTSMQKYGQHVIPVLRNL